MQSRQKQDPVDDFRQRQALYSNFKTFLKRTDMLFVFLKQLWLHQQMDFGGREGRRLETSAVVPARGVFFVQGRVSQIVRGSIFCHPRGYIRQYLETSFGYHIGQVGTAGIQWIEASLLLNIVHAQGRASQPTKNYLTQNINSVEFENP